MYVLVDDIMEIRPESFGAVGIQVILRNGVTLRFNEDCLGEYNQVIFCKKTLGSDDRDSNSPSRRLYMMI